MTNEQMAAEAVEHWRKYHPKTYRKMVKRGDLMKEASDAAKLTRMEMDTLMHGGFMPEHDAWHASLELFIFNDPAKEYNPDDDVEE